MKTAVVTGGSRGIGRAISLELASGGARIVLTCLSDLARAEDTAAEIRRSGAEACRWGEVREARFSGLGPGR